MQAALPRWSESSLELVLGGGAQLGNSDMLSELLGHLTRTSNACLRGVGSNLSMTPT